MGPQKKLYKSGLNFPEKEAIFRFLDTHLSSDVQIGLTVSGGPDSMLMAMIVLEYISKKGQEKSNLTILHVNHQTRTESNSEEQFVRTWFSDYNIVSFTYKGKIKTEKALREARWGFLETRVKKQKGEVVVFLGHNLTDRIETTFLHMLRGAGIDGIQNMQPAEWTVTGKRGKKVDGFVSLDTKEREREDIEIEDRSKNGKGSQGEKEFLLLRPLLSLSKEYIQKICIDHQLSFVQDSSNLDPTVSQRNLLRTTIFPQLMTLSGKKSGNQFFQSWQHLYEFLDASSKEVKTSLPAFYKLSGSVYWGLYSKYMACDKPKSISETKNLLQGLDIGHQTSTQFLHNFYKFLTVGQQGWIFLEGYIFFKAHKKIYLIQHTPEFRKQHTEKSWKIEDLGIYKTGDVDWSISDKKYLGAVLRFPQKGDHRKGKRLKKYLLNHHVPTFWRNYIPVIEKTGKIIAIFPYEQMKGVFW